MRDSSLVFVFGGGGGSPDQFDSRSAFAGITTHWVSAEMQNKDKYS